MNLESVTMKYIYTTILLFYCLLSTAQVVDFTYTTSTSTYCDPQRITFRQNASGNPQSFVWYFGNGTTGNTAVEEVTYLNPGTYTVKLIAIYQDVAVSTEKTITINATPTLTVRTSRSELCEPGVVEFTTTSSADVVRYSWDFGDGNTLSTVAERSISHNYTNYGNYTVKVNAYNEFGCTEIATTNVVIAPLSISGSIDITSGCIPVTPTLSITGSYLRGDAPALVTWNFGDGSTISGTETAIQHTYNTTSNMQARVSVQTQNGCDAVYEFPDFAFGTPPAAPSIATTTGLYVFCGSEDVEFEATAQNATHYVWNYGDRTSDSIARTYNSHKFRAIDTMSVVVTPYMNGCAGAADSIVVEIQGVIARFDVRNTCENKNSFTFPNNSLGVMDEIKWIYTTGNTQTVSNSRRGEITFPQVASSEVELLVVNYASGCRDSVKKNIYTALPSFHSDKSSVCRDSSIVYTIRNDYPAEAGMKYLYHLNDRTISSTTNTYSYLPANHGIYNDYVVINDEYRSTCSDTLYLSEPVRVKGPISQFEIPNFVCYDSLLTFQNNSYPFYNNEPIVEWSWNMGNNTILQEEHPQPYSYERPGNYSVILKVTDVNGCSNQSRIATKSVRLPKVDILPRQHTLCAGTPITLIAYSSDQVKWLNIPVSLCADCDTITVTPQQSINYIAQTTNSYGCRNFDSTELYVVERMNLQVHPIDTAICAGNSFAYQVSTPGIITFSPAIYLNDPHAANPYVFPAENIEYTLTVTDSLGCFTDSIRTRVRVNPNPIIEIGNDQVLAFGEPYRIIPTTNSGALQYQWTSNASYGIQGCSTCSFVNGTALDNETLTLEVTDPKGCKATDRVNIIIDCNTKQLFVPSAFTPDGDGLNDYFYPITRGYNEVKSFSIFDRSGMKVYERKNLKPNEPTSGWDGTIRGSKPNTQSFVWMVQVECDGQLITRKGSFTLIR